MRGFAFRVFGVSRLRFEVLEVGGFAFRVRVWLRDFGGSGFWRFQVWGFDFGVSGSGFWLVSGMISRFSRCAVSRIGVLC